MPYLHLSDCDLWWEECGAGPPLMMVAGLGGVGSYWNPNIPAFEEKYRVIRHDQRGTGRSTRTAVASVQQMAADAAALMDHLGLSDAAWVGHSTGGAIGTSVALDFPGRIGRLVINSSTSCGDPYRRKLFSIRRLLHAKVGPEAYAALTSILLYPSWWINENADVLDAEEARAASSLGEPEVQESRLDAILAYDRRSELGKIDIPTLVICAKDDAMTPAYFSKELASLIPGAKLQLLETGGHACSRTMLDEFNSAVMHFLSEHREFVD
ncbi:MAG: alpha/beta fold hydrolase [Bradyrhizobiaceae bacterium]|nr:MAG: alpha/beta fold hydrolase [Bradyrhizobiaceae bacterium]